MKILIIGCNSMVGHVVALYFKESGHNVTGIDNERMNFIDTLVVDFHDTQFISNFLKKESFDAVINCTAVINQNAENEKAEAVFINGYFPHFLESVTKEMQTVVVHRSTDCIFSGKRGQYSLNDTPDGTSFYARTKAIGELNNEKDITIRTSLVGPEYEENGSGLFNWFFRQSGALNGYANSIWTGITTIEYAREIEWLLTHKAYGIFQLVPDKAISKYELLMLFEKNFPSGRKVNKINNDRVDKSLNQSVQGYNIEIPSYEKMIKEMNEWIYKHSSIYTNYIKEN